MEPESDLVLALVLLCGYSEDDKRGLPQHRYLASRSKEDRAARRAIARLLRSDQPLDQQLRHALANLFDPDDAPEGDRDNSTEAVIARSYRYIAAERRIVDEFARRRAKHRAPNTMADGIIAGSIYEDIQRGLSVEDAVKKAMDKFNLTRDRVYQIWSPYIRAQDALAGFELGRKQPSVRK